MSAQQILVIDFEPSRLKATVDLIQQSGYSVATAGNSAELNGWLSGSLPAVIVLEPMLPGNDGFAICRSIKRSGRNPAPHVLVAARIFRGARYKQLAKDAGADIFLQRPEHDELLLKVIEQILGRGTHSAGDPLEFELSGPLELSAAPAAPGSSNNDGPLDDLDWESLDAQFDHAFEPHEPEAERQPSGPAPRAAAPPTTSAASAPGTSGTSAPRKRLTAQDLLASMDDPDFGMSNAAEFPAEKPAASIAPAAQRNAPQPISASAAYSSSPEAQEAAPLSAATLSTQVDERLAVGAAPRLEATSSVSIQPKVPPADPRREAPPTSPAPRATAPPTPPVRPSAANELPARSSKTGLFIGGAAAGILIAGFFVMKLIGGASSTDSPAAAIDQSPSPSSETTIAPRGTDAGPTAERSTSATNRSPNVTNGAGEIQVAAPSSNHAAAPIEKNPAGSAGLNPAAIIKPATGVPSAAPSTVLNGAEGRAPNNVSQLGNPPQLNVNSASTPATTPTKPAIKTTAPPPEPEPRAESAPEGTAATPDTQNAASPPAAPVSDSTPPAEAVEKPAAPAEEPRSLTPTASAVSKPVLIAGSRVEPVYPAMARQARRGGTVVMKVMVLSSGSVGEIEIVDEPDARLGLGKAAVAAVRRWRYWPGTVEGKAVDSSVTVTLKFTP